MLAQGAILSNRYQVVRSLGRGGMSNVYLCRDLHLTGKMWVLKEMTVSYGDPREQALAIKQFEMEANLLAHLDHPNLPQVIDYFTQGGKYYLVMEYVDGQDLGTIIAKSPGPLPEKKVIEFGIQIATVLYYLHCRKPNPIIFRDLKPSNIMVCGDLIKLIDFGIARIFNPSKAGDTMRIGSPGYAPPEQYSGQTDPRSDVYSLGVTLHQLLTKRDPASTQTPFKIPPARSLNPKVSKEMEKIIEKATRSEPNHRFSSALEMKRALQGLLQPQLTKPATAAVSSPVVSRPPRWRRISFKFALFLTVVIAFFLYLYYPEIYPKIWNLFFKPKPAPTVEPTPSEDFKSLGIKSYQDGDYEKAVDYLQKAINLERSDGETWLYYNNAYIERNKLPSVTIGVVVPEVEPYLYESRQMLKGVALAVKQANDGGGVKDKRIKVIIEKDRDDDALSQEIASRLCSNNEVLGVIGYFSSHCTIAAGSIYNLKHVPLISPTATANSISELGPFVLRVCGDDRSEYEALAKATIEVLKPKNVAVLYDSQGFSDLVAIYENNIKSQGMEIIGERQFNCFVNENFQLSIKDFMNMKPDLIFLAGYEHILKQYFSQAYEEGFRTNYLAPHTVCTEKILQKNWPEMEGLTGTAFFNTGLSNPVSAMFVDDFRIFGEDAPDGVAAQSYDAAKLLIKAMKDGGLNRLNIIAFILSLKKETGGFLGVTGVIAFNGKNTPLKEWVLVKASNGRFVMISK